MNIKLLVLKSGFKIVGQVEVLEETVEVTKAFQPVIVPGPQGIMSALVPVLSEAVDDDGALTFSLSDLAAGPLDVRAELEQHYIQLTSSIQLVR